MTKLIYSAKTRAMLAVYLAQQMFSDDEICWITGHSRNTLKAVFSKARAEGYRVPYATQRTPEEIPADTLEPDTGEGSVSSCACGEESGIYAAIRPPASMAERLDKRVRRIRV